MQLSTSDEEIVDLLLKYGAKVSSIDDINEITLGCVKRNAHTEKMKFLLDIITSYLHIPPEMYKRVFSKDLVSVSVGTSVSLERDEHGNVIKLAAGDKHEKNESCNMDQRQNDKYILWACKDFGVDMNMTPAQGRIGMFVDVIKKGNIAAIGLL